MKDMMKYKYAIFKINDLRYALLPVWTYLFAFLEVQSKNATLIINLTFI